MGHYKSRSDLTAPARLRMNNILLVCLLGASLVALSGAEVSSEEQSVAELSQLREVRAADPGNGKGKGLKKKNNKKRGGNMRKSDKKSVGKKNNKSGAKRNKKDGKNRKNGARKNGKGKKRNQKGLKKKNRNNKNKDKGKNKDRKKKDRKAAKKNEKKKDRKRNNKNRNGNNARQASCMNAACINNAVAYMKQLKLAVKNFGKQYNRITTNEKQTGGKAGKNDEFAPYLIKLRETGGGNASNLSCNGLKNEGATNLQTLYDNLATCEDIINTTCSTNMPSVNMTFLDECKATMDAFVNVTDGAIKATGADACLIWESAELAEMSTMLKPCSLKALETEHTSAKKACTGNFSYCRQEEDKVRKIVSACSASNSAEKVTAAIAQGVKNQAAATAVSQKVNDTLSARSAGFRSTNITCAAFSVEVTTVSAQVAAAPLLDSLETMLTTIASYVVAACSDADKSSLGNASATFLESAESITLAIEEKQSALNLTTGTTLSIGTTTVSATTVSTTTGTTGTTTTGTTGTTTTGTTTTGTTGTTTTGTTSTTSTTTSTTSTTGTTATT